MKTHLLIENQKSCTEVIAKHRIHGSCPLDSFFEDDDEEFELWIRKGLLKHPNMKRDGVIFYDKKHGTIDPGFDFNVAQISDKAWFYTLFEPGYSHIEVIFYYLRKIGLYSNLKVAMRYTTTDPFFDETIKSLYLRYIEHASESVIDVSSLISDYIMGYKQICGKPWFEVDHVLFPIYIELDKVGRWILGRLSFVDRLFYVYNSRWSVNDDSEVAKSVKCYSDILPVSLDLVGFYKKRYDIKQKNWRYVTKKITEPFDIVIVKGLPGERLR
ncbi:coenzyme PQQ synthesis protein E [Striga asiatica]|uniref:Coenzyme PQQ synthesis protein E n=1 Tax=Striga asiatica TaxID=4170 RepID=A0A5A7PYT1_STRAF|nr:coenzyme PQQ synthesis protein E [Striga asiatica]